MYDLTKKISNVKLLKYMSKINFKEMVVILRNIFFIIVVPSLLFLGVIIWMFRNF